jgi:cyclophilin family peptidyl-prolyl cis-trans isomerase
MCLTITFSYGCSKIGINEQEERTLIKLNTNKGNIIIKLFSEDAPETSKNFINYVEGGNYNGTVFHRVINNFMIQGGGHLSDMYRSTYR